MPEYIKQPGQKLPQRVWPHRNNRNLDKNGFRPHRKPGPIQEGRIHFDRAPGEIDRGSYAYRLELLKAAIRARSRWEQQPGYQDDGWC